MLQFKKGKIPALNYRMAVKKPIPVRCMQIMEPFEVETLEGTLRGKAGDWLLVGVRGEMYPVDRAIFAQTYELRDPEPAPPENEKE